MHEEARQRARPGVGKGLVPLRESLWLASLTYLADACRRRRPRARWPRSSTPSSRRQAGTNVMIGYGVSCYGAADRYLGMLAATLGERE